MEEHEPQKSKPTTDRKKTVGLSYLTRSKFKRISQSDNDSSESQAQQPLLKRQTRLVANQAEADTSVVDIINEDTTPDSNAVVTHTMEEDTSAQTALQNDLVLESLMRYMNRSDLLSCRVVNKQWEYEATKELRRRKLIIRFSFWHHGSQMSRNNAFRDICRSLSKCRTPSLLSSFQVKTVAHNDLGSGGVTNFFTTVGNQLKRLTLRLNYSMSRSSSFERSSLMTQLHNLLFRQAPNLEFLEIKFDFPDRWKNELLAFDSPGHLQNDNGEFGLLPNLKFFIVDGTPPPKFFADVINASVNLRSVGGVWSTSSFIKWVITAGGRLTPLRGFSSACIKYFMGAEGREKIHLLKSFRVYLANDINVQSNKLDIELIETFLTKHKQDLQLESFECVSKLFYEDVTFAPRIVGVINQILECSAGSLSKLRIEPVKWFEDLLIIPRLPKLQEICFDCFWSNCLGPGDGGLFPRGFNMNHSFPNVSTIVLLECAPSFFRLFVERMETEIKEPVPSIRRILMIVSFKGSGVPPRASDLHHVFPNLLSFTCVESDKYYKI